MSRLIHIAAVTLFALAAMAWAIGTVGDAMCPDRSYRLVRCDLNASRPLFRVWARAKGCRMANLHTCSRSWS